MEKTVERIREAEKRIRKREEIMERIDDTEANSAQRAHAVESFINEEASHNDLNINDMYVDDLEQFKKKLKVAKDIKDICYLVDEASRFIKNLAEQISEEKGGE